MENKYTDFFSELKYFLVELGIDDKKDIDGCSDSEISAIESSIDNTLPLAYKDYLKSIGRYFLFELFDAEQMSYDDFDDIKECVEDALEETKFQFDQPYFPISHRRYEYFRFIYLNGSDNPDVWFFDEFPDSGEHITNSKQDFIQMMLNFFSQILINKPFGFNWVTDEEEKNNKNVIRDRHLDWFESLLKLKEHIQNTTSDDPLLLELHNRFSSHFTPEYEQTALKELNTYNRISTSNKNHSTLKSHTKRTNTSIWSKLKSLWK